MKFIPPEADVWHMEDKVLQYQKTKDASTVSFIFQSFEPLISNICSKFFFPWGDKDDLLQEGRVGLFKAVRRYDPKKNMGFARYAIYSIRCNVIAALRAYSRTKHSILTNAYSIQEPVAEGISDRTWEFSLRSELPEPDENILMHEDVTSCHKLLCKTLSELEFKTFLRWVQGEEYGDIAEKLGNTMKSVDNALQRAKRDIMLLDMKDPDFLPAFRHYLSYLCNGLPYGTIREKDILHAIFQENR